MVTLTALLTICVWIQAQTTSGENSCPSTPSKLVDFDVAYSVPHFQTNKVIQNIALNLESPPTEVYLGSQNSIVAISNSMTKLWEVKTGPLDSPDCQTCKACDIESDPEDSVDTDNKVLLFDPVGVFLPYLYVCGSTQHGICFFIDTSGPAEPKCLYKRERNSPDNCPDCVASPLGTKVTIVEQGATSLFFVAASVNDTVVKEYPRKSISVVRPLATEDGFEMVINGMTVLPSLRNSYKLDYIYSFSTKDYVYFLSLQREVPSLSNSPFQTRLGRLPISSPELWLYREVVLECRFEPKRRRRRIETRAGDIVYNGLQAAYFGQAGKDLADELRVDVKDDILFGVFAKVDKQGAVQKNSALCAFPLSKVNHAIEVGVEACCKSGTEQLSRGLCHFQQCENCPHEVSNQTTTHFTLCPGRK